MATKNTTIRLDKEMIEEVDNRCKELECTRNDYIKSAIDTKLEIDTSVKEESNENSQDQEVVKDTKPKEPTPTIGTIKTTNDGSK